MDAFHTLTRDRQIGMAIGPIPWVAVDRFVLSRLERGWIDGEEAIDLEFLVLALDNTDLIEKQKRTPKPDTDPKGGATP